MSLRKSVALSVVAALIILSSVIFYPDLDDWFPFISIIMLWVVWAIAAVLTGTTLWFAIRARDPRRALGLAIVSMAAAIAYRFPEALSGDVRFQVLRPYYEMQVARAQSKYFRSPEAEFDGGMIAFRVTNGWIDNSTAVVYDPNDSLELNKKSMRFDGDMYCSKRLAAHWYSCGFT